MNRIKRITVITLGILLLVGCDITTKNKAHEELKNNSSKSFLGGSVQLVYTENSAGMLSFGDELPAVIKFVVFRIIVGILLIALLIYSFYRKDISKFQLLAITLILSGGFGNLIDRIFNDGNVVDFIVLKIFNWHTGIFNLADLYVTTGVTILIVSSIILTKREEETAALSTNELDKDE
ncbi:signal peptidase II [Bacteroidota bacterium]